MPSSRRLHHWSLLFLVGDTLRGLLLPLGAAFFASRQSQWDLWLAWLSIPVAGLSVWRYFTTRYELADDELVVRTGLLFRNVRHIRYARIQNLEHVQGPLHRWLGVAEVRVETAGASEPEARLRVLSSADADEVRRRIGEGKRRAARTGEPSTDAGPTAEAAGVDQPPRTLVRLGLRDVIAFGLTQSRGGVVLGAALGVVWEANQFGLGFDRPTDMVGEYLSRLHAEGRLLDDPSPLLLLLPFAAAAAVVAVIRLLSVGWAVVQLYGFTLTREGDELRTSRGLLTRVRGTIPLGRIQLVTVRQPLLMRLFDRVEVRVQTAGGDQGAGAGREWLAPSLPSAAVDDLVAEVYPGVRLADCDWQAPAPLTAWRLRRAGLRGLGVALLLVGLVPALRVAALIAIVPAAALLWLAAGRRARNLGYVLLPEHVGVRDGWWFAHRSLARYTRIQAVSGAISPFDRRWDMATVAADTAGGGDHRLRMPYLTAAAARAFQDRLRERARGTVFRW